jgi:hypothetical protein
MIGRTINTVRTCGSRLREAGKPWFRNLGSMNFGRRILAIGARMRGHEKKRKYGQIYSIWARCKLAVWNSL